MAQDARGGEVPGLQGGDRGAKVGSQHLVRASGRLKDKSRPSEGGGGCVGRASLWLRLVWPGLRRCGAGRSRRPDRSKCGFPSDGREYGRTTDSGGTITARTNVAMDTGRP
ncbi:predicted protein [Chaetomium globosum CBS 148.51]|uniref:Uncharacterized protein n=1 Tax=Chaetomium globosum (strain ATCC 6205 / CBS 148.51 / DSM 1962 / NBRC 6347 / NRRL 1970) TaxID=306901 RepID=Q2HD36_CHAGB|nr:uncharacterized protein CHGG_01868 [Chaetomium globosum CBS 148.51]EAQ93633.1 predicted protein [Chaetomium globosum CBS 148.51]